MGKPKDICSFYYKEIYTEQGARHQCLCGKVLKKNRSGYTNLINHLKTAHPNYEREFLDISKQRAITKYVPSSQGKNIFGWLDWVIMEYLPFSFVEKERSRSYTRLNPISRNSFVKYMHKLTEMVEAEISTLLESSGRFSIVLDGWSDSDSTHYIGVFALSGGKFYLLAFSTLPDEERYDAEIHVQFISESLSYYKKTFDDVLFLICDNENTNKAISSLCKIPMLGCQSHRLNLAVKNLCSTLEPIIDNINCLMIKLDTLKFRGALRKVTKYSPVKRNSTRWSSTYAMIKRFFVLREFIPEALFDFIPSPSDELKLQSLMKDLENIESVSKALQSENISVVSARELLDSLCKDYPVLQSHIHPFAPIVKNPELESAICLVMDGKEESLSVPQVQALKRYVKNDIHLSVVSSEDETLTYAEKVLKKRKIEAAADMESSRYIDFGLVTSPTSNIVERLFSKAKLVSTDNRKSLLPRNLESVLFLMANRSLWDERLVDKALQEMN
jgi:hypothetical protein